MHEAREGNVEASVAQYLTALAAGYLELAELRVRARRPAAAIRPQLELVKSDER